MCREYQHIQIMEVIRSGKGQPADVQFKLPLLLRFCYSVHKRPSYSLLQIRKEPHEEHKKNKRVICMRTRRNIMSLKPMEVFSEFLSVTSDTWMHNLHQVVVVWMFSAFSSACPGCFPANQLRHFYVTCRISWYFLLDRIAMWINQFTSGPALRSQMSSLGNLEFKQWCCLMLDLNYLSHLEAVIWINFCWFTRYLFDLTEN